MFVDIQILKEPNIWEKLKNIDLTCHRILSGERGEIPIFPGRDVEIRLIKDLPPKKGISYAEGQGRMLHDLASIELQAMELGLRTLIEFPEAPKAFREELAAITLDEAKHLRLCLNALEELGFPWGSFPTHLGLWQAVGPEDDLLDRILIVHRYLEGAGLDASTQLLNRLSGIPTAGINKVVEVIAHDEVGHVQFGSRWYQKLCRDRGLDPDLDFRERISSLFHRIPRRLEKINVELRKQVGFTASEIDALAEMRERWLKPLNERIHPVVKNATDLP